MGGTESQERDGKDDPPKRESGISVVQEVASKLKQRIARRVRRDNALKVPPLHPLEESCILRTRAAYAAAAPAGWYHSESPDGKPHIVVHDKKLAQMLLSLDGLGKHHHESEMAKALFFVSQEGWTRQRNALRLAIGNPASFDTQYGPAAERAGSWLVLQLRSLQGADPSVVISDLHPLIQASVALAMVEIVFGETNSSLMNEIVQLILAALSPALHNSKKQKEAEQAVGALKTKISRLVNASIALIESGSSISDGLLSTLLQQGKQPSAPSPCPHLESVGLGRDEVVCNVVWILLFGTESTSLVTTLALLHLAEDDEVQRMCSAEVSGASQLPPDADAAPFEGAEALRWGVVAKKCPSVSDVIRETQRLYPPFFALQRTVSNPEGIVVTAPSAQGPQKYSLPPGSLITVCTVGPSREGVSQPWVWRPFRPKEEGGTTQGMAYGFGSRTCPAGGLAAGVARVLVCRALATVTLSPAPIRSPVSPEVPSSSGSPPVMYPWETAVKPHPNRSTIYLASPVAITSSLKGDVRLSSLPPPTDLPAAQQRTDDLGPAVALRAVGERSPPPSPDIFPRVLWLMSVDSRPVAQGEYQQSFGSIWHGMPVWMSSGDRVIFADAPEGQSRRWRVGTRESLTSSTAWLVSKSYDDHLPPPHLIAEWRFFNPKLREWVHATDVKVTDSVPEGWADAAYTVYSLMKRREAEKRKLQQQAKMLKEQRLAALAREKDLKDEEPSPPPSVEQKADEGSES